MTRRRPVRLATDTAERMRRVAWPPRPKPKPRTSGTPRIAVVTVNYNTGPLVARLLYSLQRVLEPGLVREIVVVDNGSTDGSVELLGPLADAGLIRIVANPRHPYHGPGLNRGVSFVARSQRAKTSETDLVWVLDSDVVVLRPDALRIAIAAMRASHAVMIGQQQPYDQARPKLDRYAHPAALLFDPAVVWRHSVPAFLEDGAPAVVMQHVLRRRGHVVADFPWFAEAYLLHLGSGTLSALVRDAHTDNRYYDWATAHPDPHYHGRPDGRALHEQFEARFRSAVPELGGAALLAACAPPGGGG